MAYENPFIRVREDRVVHPGGRDGMYGVLEGAPGAAIVAVTEDERVYLVGQPRYAQNVFAWDLPEGAAHEGESTIAAAQRELLEEVGLTAGRWSSLGAYHPQKDIIAYHTDIYLAQDLSGEGRQRLDETELITVQTLPLDEAFNRAMDGSFTGATTVIGLARAWHRLR